LRFETYRDYLIYYARLWVRVVPVRYMSKEPVLPWRKFGTEVKIPIGALENFLRRGYNLAVLCGAPSAGLVVLDFESMGKVEEVFPRWGELLKKTVVVKTARGCHIWLRCEKLPESMHFPDHQLEIRSEGRLAVCPPSRHPSGIFYEFINAPSNIALVDSIVPLVAKLKDELDYEYRPPDSVGSSLRWRFTGKEPCLVYIKCGVPEGQRNNAALILASYLYRHVGLDEEDVLEKLLAWNELNQPPLPKRGIGNVWKSGIRDGYAFGCKGVREWGCCKSSCPLVRYYHST